MKTKRWRVPRMVQLLVGLPLWLIMCVVELIALIIAIISIPININFANRVCEWAETLPDAKWYFGKKPNERGEPHGEES